MNPYRFEVLAMWSRAVPQFAPTAECSVWATDDERLLGVVIMDMTDRDYNFVILARDKHGRFRAVDVGQTYFTRRMAEVALIKRMPEVHAKEGTAFEQGDETEKHLDFFTPLSNDRLHSNFLILADGPDCSAAREIITEMANVFDEPLEESHITAFTQEGGNCTASDESRTNPVRGVFASLPTPPSEISLGLRKQNQKGGGTVRGLRPGAVALHPGTRDRKRAARPHDRGGREAGVVVGVALTGVLTALPLPRLRAVVPAQVDPADKPDEDE